MSTHRNNQAVPKLPQRILLSTFHFCRRGVSTLIARLLQGLFWLGMQRRQSAATPQGFVLPTSILLLLVVSLTVGSIGLRTLSRTQQTIGQREQQIIYNAATPAIDRARAKLEYLFTQDPRLPNGVPGEDDLLAMMLNDGQPHNGVTYQAYNPSNNDGDAVDPYTFPDEDGNRFDLDGDDIDDNAWYFDVDLPDGSGVGKTARVIYSIIFATPSTDESTNEPELSLNDTRVGGVEARSAQLMVRNGPLSLANLGATCLTQQVDPEGGWFGITDTSELRKNFQVSAVVIPGTGEGDDFVPDEAGTIATLELQQDRKVDKGNKWGAWFQNDLEIFPGEAFPWNGAIYTNGNLVVGKSEFKAYLISSTASCLNTSKEDSEIVVGKEGEVVVGRFDSENPRFYKARIDIFQEGNVEEDKLLRQANDSVTRDGDLSEELGESLGVDPAKLMIESKLVHRNEATADTLGVAKWAPGDNIDQRIRLEDDSDTSQLALDDVYRADDRAGPMPSYVMQDDAKTLTDLGKSLGESLKTGLSAEDEEALTKLGDPNTPEDVGADGYWERRARNQGMRLIVGQRLELGNAMGWGGLDPTGNFKALNQQNLTGNPGRFYLDDSYDDAGEDGYKPGFYDDPLMPWDTCHPDTDPNDGTPNPSTNNDDRCHEARQRRSLRDNLAAVQATAIYHANSAVTPNVSDGDTPLACLATTVHPGTAETLRRSATFEDLTAEAMLTTSAMTNTLLPLPNKGYSLILSDFFAGRGTNGWEFNPPAATVNADMEQALWNLAHYAGDPNGGAPSFPVTQETGDDAVVHPYPYMSMWGDFAILRRILEEEGTAPTSPADKTTLHTAECLLGMLAYNVDYLAKFDINEVDTAANGISVNTLRAALDTIDAVLNSAAGTAVNYGGVALSGDVITAIERTVELVTANPANAYNRGRPPSLYIAALENWINEDWQPFANELQARQVLALARLYMQKKQVERDRLHGFEATTTGVTCHPDLTRLCTDQPKYPILYSLFPGDLNNNGGIDGTDQHGERRGTNADRTPASEFNTRGFDPENNPPFSAKPGTTDLTDATFNGNDGDLYQGVEVANVAIRPRALDEWVLPYDDSFPRNVGTGIAVSQETPHIVCVGKPCKDGTDVTRGMTIEVGLKDAALFDGRQLLNTRVLDLDLKLLRTNKVEGTQDYWLPLSGIIYGFREDTIREDMIVRPPTVADETCETAADLATDDCLMKAAELPGGNIDRDALTSTDPAISNEQNITPKPVDYTPDPDRRAHGFRLRNGETVKRAGDNGKGLSFISDAPVYILGDFNWHRERDLNIQRPDQQLQEFTLKLAYGADDFYSNFYDREEVDPRFASSTEDDWRPVEIISDAVSILSGNFCDGSVWDVFDWRDDRSLDDANYGCQQEEQTSYLNWPLPSRDEDWVRENPFDSQSPVIFTRNGNPLIKDGTTEYKDYDKGYLALGFRRDSDNLGTLIPAEDTTVNASLISRIVPSRQYQSYGGFHNFPRLLENWNVNNDATLTISGAFFQLDFSRSATAPYDQVQWEPAVAVAAESRDIAVHRYYTPAIRRWGYDVALRYAPAAPISSRFVTVNAARDEFYSEPPAEDPYIVRLCESALPNCPIG